MHKLPLPHQGKGRREAKGAMQVDREQMDNVSSDIVLQLMMDLRLKVSVWVLFSRLKGAVS